MPTLFRRILVPYDFSAPARAGLRVAAELAGAARGRLDVLHVLAPYPLTGLTPADGIPYIAPEDLAPPVRMRLEKEVRSALGRRRVPARCRVVVGDAAQEIVAAARGADSIVMATAGRTGLEHLLIGSVAEKVVRHASCPVLTIRARSPRRRRTARRR